MHGSRRCRAEVGTKVPTITRSRILGASLAAALIATVVNLTAAPANATTYYISSHCSSNTACFALFYNSLSGDGIFNSACFITNRDEYSHAGFSSDGTAYRFIFSRPGDQPNSSMGFPGPGHRCFGSGSGEGLKNNAAGVVNGDTRTHRVYYNTGYAGSYQTIRRGTGGNLRPDMKNQNASSERF